MKATRLLAKIDIPCGVCGEHMTKMKSEIQKTPYESHIRTVRFCRNCDFVKDES